MNNTRIAGALFCVFAMLVAFALPGLAITQASPPEEQCILQENQLEISVEAAVAPFTALVLEQDSTRQPDRSPLTNGDAGATRTDVDQPRPNLRC